MFSTGETMNDRPDDGRDLIKIRMLKDAVERAEALHRAALRQMIVVGEHARYTDHPNHRRAEAMMQRALDRLADRAHTLGRARLALKRKLRSTYGVFG